MSHSGSRAGDGAEPAGRGLVALFTGTTFLAAFLLFLVEPMVTKMLLPLLGGAPAAWNTAMVFFQAALLGGYAFAFASMRWLSARAQTAVQLCALALPLLLLPVAVPAGWVPPSDQSPVWWTLLVLVPMVGAPFLMLASMGPTLQRWFSRTSHPRAHDPYFLYAAGNTGSLLALLAYPFVFEAAMPLTRQARLWAGLYAVLVVAATACVVLERRKRSPEGAAPVPRGASAPAPSIAWRTRGRWIFLAFIPSTLMLGVTRHLASDVASFPLLWVVPLAIYLVTFIVAFGRESSGIVAGAARVLRLMVVPLTLAFFTFIPYLWIEVPLHLIPFAAAALVAHARLAADRPGPARLTEFYLWLSVGGVLGGIFAALIAPLIFTNVLEYPIAIVLALAVVPRATTRAAGERRFRLPTIRETVLAALMAAAAVSAVVIRQSGSSQDIRVAMLIAAAGLAGAYVLARTPAGYAAAVGSVLLLAFIVPAEPTLFAERTFFGVHRVYATAGTHVLANGVTVHGIQNVGPTGALIDTPAAYYAESGPAGRVFATLRARLPMRIGVVGAGAAELAAYGRPGDSITFYEIDDAVIRVATDPSLFSYVRDSKASVNFVLGDGRLSLEQDPAARYDLLVLDAYSSDSIPTHLLTDQAVQLYLNRLNPGGLLLFNLSNRFFDLEPILARIAAQHHLAGLAMTDQLVTLAQAAQGKLASTWVVMARSTADLGSLATDPAWHPLGTGAGAPLWTDDYTNLLGTLR